MTREELRLIIREELRVLLKEEFREMLNAELRAPEFNPNEVDDIYQHGDERKLYWQARESMNQDLHYFRSLEKDFVALDKRINRLGKSITVPIDTLFKMVNNVADAIWPGHGPQDDVCITRPDTVLGVIKEYQRNCFDDPIYKDIRLSNIEKAVEYFQDDVGELLHWLDFWSMCPYPERPWSGEAYVDLGEDTPDRNQSPFLRE